MKVSWLSDVHLDHVSDPQTLRKFTNQLSTSTCDAFVITGDISNSQKLDKHLSIIANSVSKPVYFVLGNHDFWFSSIEYVRQIAIDSAYKNSKLHYLTSVSCAKLSETTALVGHDGWYDGAGGEHSTFGMNDWRLISDYRFQAWSMFDIVAISSKLAAEASKKIKDDITVALEEGYTNVIVATHVPPWNQAHIHEGQVGNDNAQPWFTSPTLGAVLYQLADENPHVNFTVLAGHTHGSFDGKIAHNLTCKVQGAEYDQPGSMMTTLEFT